MTDESFSHFIMTTALTPHGLNLKSLLQLFFDHIIMSYITKIEGVGSKIHLTKNLIWSYKSKPFSQQYNIYQKSKWQRGNLNFHDQPT